MPGFELSRYNSFSRIEGTDDYVIVNSLSAQADILSAKEYRQIQDGKLSGHWPHADTLFEKGYLVNPSEEAKEYRKAYLAFLDQREKEEVQLFFVPSYACNFSCSYCYQSGYNPDHTSLSREVVDAFFTWIDSRFDHRKKYITLFGGEPLLNGKEHREILNYFIEQVAKRNLDLAVVTNGYYLKESLPWLSKARIREIQVTLDGPKVLHDQRRFLKNGNPTFDQIAEGINSALGLGVPINLRVVLDKDNISSLRELAHFAKEQGWTTNPRFKTQLGRNYELHYCQARPDHLQSRLELYQELYRQLSQYPEILDFHRPAFHILKFLSDRGSLPPALFDSCPGCKSEWAFDYTGRIYSCTATVGKQGEELGRFYPSSRAGLNEELVGQWQDRDVLSISKCKDCAVQLICGGGCASLAKNKLGSIHAPDCRPVQELIGLGAGLYLKRESQGV